MCIRDSTEGLCRSDGVKVLLLSASPLVRKSLPNAAAIMSEYFSFKRRPQEPIAQFLARESLGFEEFAEALAQLKEEKEGHDPALRNFDLHDMSPPPDESDHDGRLISINGGIGNRQVVPTVVLSARMATLAFLSLTLDCLLYTSPSPRDA